ncbi:hypothetical protein L207DRAFT_635045 [Hyaloscypha variabilis F]|uniref:Uncharacterized protein n=1 Tax=Hyaloscypha variabilis (strain UAMH 11265 / GT02V1 / F) TaxID=1149755 RepID=A0A2J6RKL1_HYAVF|nr:hypothetical protein L207DRAFT_635045 [Hyaloscypha variabilis F]
MERKIHPSATSKPKREFTSSSLTKPMTSQSKCKAHPASSGTKTATPPSIHSTSDQEASFGMNFESTAQLQPAFATALHVAKQQTQSSRLLSLPAEILDMTLDYIFSTLDLSLSTYTHSLTVVQATPKFRKTVPFYFMSVADSDTWPSRNMEPCLRPWRLRKMYLAIRDYMNNHPEETKKFSHFADYSFKYQPIISPGWFNSKYDVLLLRNRSEGFAHKKTLMLTNDHLKSLAIERTVLDPDDDLSWSIRHLFHELNEICIGGSSLGPGIHHGLTPLESLQSLTLLLPTKHEIIVFTKASKLEAGRWAVSLDTASEQFREEMGHSWANVTWRVILGHDQQSKISPREMMSTWGSDWKRWHNAKERLGRNDPKVGQSWKTRLWDMDAEFYQYSPGTWGKVENGDRRIYWGESP